MVRDVPVQNVPASDGGMNPHIHGTGTLRTITAEGFGLKERPWNSMFRCIHAVRMNIANAINRVATMHGLDPLVTADAN